MSGTAIAHTYRSSAIEHYRTEDIECLVERYRAGPIRIVQTSSGHLGASIDAVVTPRLELRCASFQANVLNVVERPLGRFGFAICLEGDVRILGRRLTDSNYFATDGSDGILARLDHGVRWCNLSFDKAYLAGLAERNGYRIPVGSMTAGLPHARHRELSGLLVRLAAQASDSGPYDDELEDQVACSVLEILDRDGSSESRGHRASTRAVMTALEYIHVRFADPVSLSSLSRQTGMSERSLRTACRRVTGMTLQHYLTRYRLIQAHRLLLNDEVATVRDAARACGLPHASRFSGYYLAMFGEMPRETLSRRPWIVTSRTPIRAGESDAPR